MAINLKKRSNRSVHKGGSVTEVDKPAEEELRKKVQEDEKKGKKQLKEIYDNTFAPVEVLKMFKK